MPKFATAIRRAHYLLSDEVRERKLTLVGFGVDPHAHLDQKTLRQWSAAGGHIVQICHRGQKLHRASAAYVWEDITGSFLPAMAPFGWVAVVRPDNVLLTDGAVADSARLVSEALALVQVSADYRLGKTHTAAQPG